MTAKDGAFTRGGGGSPDKDSEFETFMFTMMQQLMKI